MSTEDLVVGKEKVTAVFGSWPAFHDAEIIRVGLDRGPVGGGAGPTLDLVIHAFEATREVDTAGLFVLRNHVLVHLRFDGVVELDLGGFNEQNVLFELVLTDIRDRQMEGIRLEVRLDSSFGLSGGFQCRGAEVVSVTPCDATGAPTTG